MPVVVIRKWNFYTTATGANPVEKEIKKHKLTTVELTKLQVVMDRVAEGRTRSGDVKPLRDGVLEVRVHVANRELRLAFAEVGGGLILLALRFFRKQRQVEARHIDVAAERLRDWQSRRDGP
jgi:putative component of toxin-antitoxin plasmid stabilization module